MAHTVDLKELKRLLADVSPGSVVKNPGIVMALASSWDELRYIGLDGGMKAEKITTGRIEDLTWEPPMLKFQIERHGGTVNGSTRAELQRWRVNVETGTCELYSSGRRQLTSMAKRWDHKPIALVLAEHLRSGKDHAGLRWAKTGKATISRTIIPAASAPTTNERAKRLNKAIGEALGDPDWRLKVWRH